MRYSLMLFTLLLLSAGAVSAHGDLTELIDELSKEYNQQPSEELLIRRARAYLDQNNARAARKDLNHALEHAPQRYEIWYWLAKAQLKLGQPARALAAAESYLAAAPDDTARASGLIVKGDALHAAGELRGAGEAYAAALALEAEPNPEDVLKAVDAFHAAGDARWLNVLDDGLRRLGPLVSLQERGHTFDMRDGRYESALARIEQMLSSGLRRPQLLYEKGLTLSAMNRREEARAALQAARAELDKLPELRREIPAFKQLRIDIERELDSSEHVSAQR